MKSSTSELDLTHRRIQSTPFAVEHLVAQYSVCPSYNIISDSIYCSLLVDLFNFRPRSRLMKADKM